MRLSLPKDERKNNLDKFLVAWLDRIVPFAVEFGGSDAELLKFLVADGDARFVVPRRAEGGWEPGAYQSRRSDIMSRRMYQNMRATEANRAREAATYCSVR